MAYNPFDPSFLPEGCDEPEEMPLSDANDLDAVVDRTERAAMLPPGTFDYLLRSKPVAAVAQPAPPPELTPLQMLRRAFLLINTDLSMDAATVSAATFGA